MSVDPSFMQEEKALEIAEHLARQLISSQAEKVAAAGCTRHLQNLLRKIPPAEQVEAGFPVRCSPKLHKKRQAAQSPSEVGKENAPPMQCTTEKSCVQKKLSGAQDAELELQAQLSAMAHSTGRLRAQCTGQQERVQQLQANLIDARELLIERTAETTSLRERSVELMDEFRQRDAILSEMTQSASGEAPRDVQKARSELHNYNSELSELSRRFDILQRHRVMEIYTFREEAEERADEQTALKRANEEVHSEFYCLREMLKHEEEQVRNFHNQEEKNLAQLREMGLHSQHTNVQLEEQCCTWQHEVQAQRAQLQELQKEHAAAQAVQIAQQVHAEEAVAEKMIHLESRSEVSACELADMRAAMLSQRERVAGEQQLCMRLAARLKSKERAVRRWRQEKCQPKDQQQVLKTIEQRLKTLQSNLANGAKCTKVVASVQPAKKPTALQTSPQCEVGGVPLDICREEAARILGAAAPRLGVAGDGHAGDRAGGSNLPCHGDLSCLANATREAVKVIRAELVRLLHRLRASLPPRALASTANHDRLTVRALLCELRETLCISSLNVQDQSVDIRYCSGSMRVESPNLRAQSSITEEPNLCAKLSHTEGLGFETVKLATMKAELSLLEDSQASSATKVSTAHTPPRVSGVAAEMVPPTTLAASSGHGPAPSRHSPMNRAAVSATRPRTISYPESLAGSPACQRSMHSVLDSLDTAVPPAKWEPEEEMCIKEFLQGCGKRAPHDAEQVVAYAPGSPVGQAPVLLCAELPSGPELPHAASPSTMLPHCCHAASPSATLPRAESPRATPLPCAASPNATWIAQPESPSEVSSVKLLPRAESPSAYVRRARGRLRELRFGLARPLGSRVQAEVCSPTPRVPLRSSSMPLLMH
mmetsp:Transcript_95558/g.166008  ORF Transcript_95558/g.166008 Transcript_95558/m.166008 type:complete len:882 (-) Transcript_95558:116-2761(-)